MKKNWIREDRSLSAEEYASHVMASDGYVPFSEEFINTEEGMKSVIKRGMQADILADISIRRYLKPGTLYRFSMSCPCIPMGQPDMTQGSPEEKGLLRCPPAKCGDIDGFYYISDIHLEFLFSYESQGRNMRKDIVMGWISDKVRTMTERMEHKAWPLLIAGDTSHGRELFRLFLHVLRPMWKGPIVTVLGNHEYWNGHPEGMLCGYRSPDPDRIVSLYRADAVCEGCFLLENDLLLLSRGNLIHMTEREVMETDETDLYRILEESERIFIGGTGFAGLSRDFNADDGIYRAAVRSRIEEKMRSERMDAVTEKVWDLTYDRAVTVLSHMPHGDWSEAPMHPGWIYVSGHTHENGKRKEGGAVDLHDGQIGYERKTLRVKEYVF